MLTGINRGIRAGGGIGEVIDHIAYTESTNLWLGRFFYDILFFTLINIIMLNIIMGIIVDTFSSLRK